MNRGVQATLNQQVIDGLDILILACVGGSEDAADTDCVLVDKIDSLLGVDHVSLLGTVD